MNFDAFANDKRTQQAVVLNLLLIGEAAARYIGLSQPVSTGFVATLAYLGPRGAEALLAAWLCRKK